MANAERIDNYLSKSSDILYIQSTSIERFMDEIFGGLFEQATEAPDIEHRVKAFIRCAELCYLDIKLVRPHADKFMRLGMLADAAFKIFKNIDARRLLLFEMTHSLESAVSRKALLGATYGIALYQEQNDCPELAFKSLFIGSVLRDLSLEDGEGLESPNYTQHPERTIHLLRQFNIVDDTMETMIRQHHEAPMGNGFPLGLKRVETYPPAQCLYLGDWLVEEMEGQLDYPECKQGPPFVSQIQDALPEENQRKLPVILRVLHAAFRISNQAA